MGRIINSPSPGDTSVPPAERTPTDVGPAFSGGRRIIGRQILPTGLVAIDDPGQAAQALKETYQYASNPGNENRGVVYRAVDAEEAKAFDKATGLNLEGFNHVADIFGARHVIENHGNAKVEALLGQVPMTADDFSRVPEITRPENIVAQETRNGMTTFTYQKDLDGKQFVVEEVRNKRRQLTLKTAYKRKGGGGKSGGTMLSPEGEPPNLTSENDRHTPPPSDDGSIANPAAPVKQKIKAAPAEPFTRPDLQKRINAAYQSEAGGVPADVHQFAESLPNPFTFARNGPYRGEIASMVGGKEGGKEGAAIARSSAVTFTDHATESGGEDAISAFEDMYGARGEDYYWSLVRERAGIGFQDALAHARNSPDPLQSGRVPMNAEICGDRADTGEQGAGFNGAAFQ